MSPRLARLFRWVLWSVVLLAALAGAIVLAFTFSPWPAALLVRRAFDEEGWKVSRALAKHVPKDVSELLNESYDPTSASARLDVFAPSASAPRALPTIVWTHGGGWVSGSKDQIANYARILAGRGFTVVTVGYRIAPGATYPGPVRQVNAALGHVLREAARYRVDPDRIFLAGDSAGAHISAQVANVATVASYAEALGVQPALTRRQLRGVLLFCGPFDVGMAELNGPFANFLRTVLWSYSGTKDFQSHEPFRTASIINYVTTDFPPAFITVGNADPLRPHSEKLARKLTDLGASVETLFFPADHQPALGHEYQFNLDLPEAREALEAAERFIRVRAGG
ncbi:MAG: alpha/beta hydrolase [Verrucomicrobia bacterium]|nr:alpha/beta hydrolase [Verrucomicrobiota bacterium]